MGMFGKQIIPRPRDVDLTQNNILKTSQELQSIIMQYNWKEKNNINLNALEYVLFLYDSVFYRVVMSLKYSGFFIKSSFRTIFIILEENNKKLGVNVIKNQLWDMFVNLVNKLEKIAETNQNQLESVAIYLLKTELFLTNEELDKNHDLVEKIASHFNDIINLNLDKI